jgi:general secretion pathway protein D
LITLRASKILLSVVTLFTLITVLSFPFSAQSADKVSFFFDNADVYEVIQSIFGDVLKVNYVIDANVKGTVNFRTNIPIARKDLLPVMEIILRLNGIGMVEEQGIYTIVPLTDVTKEPSPIRFGNDPKGVEIKGMVIVQIIPIEHIPSTELIKTLNPFITKGAAIMDMPEHNFIVLSDVDKNVKRILEIIDIFDEEAYQEIIRPNIYVYSLKNSRADNVAKILQELFLGGSRGASKSSSQPLVKTTPKVGTTRQPTTPQIKSQPVRQQTQPKTAIDEEPLVAPGTKIFHDEASNSIIILATKTDYKLIEDTIRKIDLIPRQVLIEVLVVDINLTGELTYGVEWFFKSGENRFGFGTTRNQTGINAPEDDAFTGFGLPTGLTFLHRDRRGRVAFLLRALAAEGKLRVLASPHIIASDNNESKIQIGTEEPIITQNEDVGTGDTSRIVQNVQYRDTGIILTVKPQINEGGLISMDVKTEESRVDTSRDTVGGSPPFLKTEAITNLIVQDGETIVIGGLIQERRENNVEGIPFLSKIPWLGILFRSQSETTVRRELMITLTPRVIRDTQESNIVYDEFLDKLHFLTNEFNIKERIIPEDIKERQWQRKSYQWQKKESNNDK